MIGQIPQWLGAPIAVGGWLNFASRAFSNKGMTRLVCRALLTVLLLPMFGWGPVTASSGAAAELAAARQSLSAALAAKARAAAEYLRLQKDGAATATELEDYQTFLDRLQRNITMNCQTVSRLKADIGDVSPEPHCGRNTRVEQLPLSFPNEQTEGERVVVLERRLGASLSEFDEMLLREMEQLARTQSGSPDAGSGSGALGGDQAGSDAGEDSSAAGETPGDKTAAAANGSPERQTEGSQEQAASGDVRDRRQSAKAGHAGAKRDAKRDGAAARDEVPDAGDDDVVARQLREAAESETDPELREKLWEEYRRYKSGRAKAQ